MLQFAMAQGKKKMGAPAEWNAFTHIKIHQLSSYFDEMVITRFDFQLPGYFSTLNTHFC